MPVTTVHTWTNVTLPSAPPDQLLPDANGIAVPIGKTFWQLNIDQANVPANQQYGFWIQYQRLAQWTDKAGGVHAAGEWLNDAGSDTFQGGTMPKGGTVNFLGSSIGARDSNGNMIEPYPDNVRVRITKMQNWLFPTITLTMG